MRNLYQILKKFFEMFISDYEIYDRPGVVQSVDLAKRTCNVTLLDGGALEDIKLQAQASLTSGVVVVPSVNSQVMVSFQGRTYGYVSQYTTVSQVLIDTDEIIINGGTFDGMVKINDLTTKLNLLRSEMQTELGKIVVSFTGVGGTYTPATLSAFSKSDYENTKIKQ